MANIYVSSTKHAAVAQWAASTSYPSGSLVRQLASPVAGQERVFVSDGGTSNVAEPVWTVTAGGTTIDNDITWTEVTGQAVYNGDGGGTDWAAPHSHLANSFASGWGAAGDTFFVGDDHAETRAAAMSLTSPGTAASPCRVLCVDDSAAPPTALATTGTVTTTGNSNISFSGHAYCYGITFSAGTGANTSKCQFASTSSSWWRLEQCSLERTGTNTGGLQLGPNTTSPSQLVELINSHVKLAVANDNIEVNCPFRWRGGTLKSSATLPTNLLSTDANTLVGRAEVEGVDLSVLGSGKNLVIVGNTYGRFVFRDCKLGSSVGVLSGSITNQGGTQVDLINCDSGDTNYRTERYRYQGTITTETTIVRSGGASDGTTSVSRKMVSSANSNFNAPLELEDIVAWNETTGSSVTATVEIVNDGSTLTDEQIWLEIEYLGTSGFPLALYASDRKADNLATAANQTTSSETWTTTGLGSPVKQKLAVTFTPQEKGVVRGRVMLAKPSTTVYVDPHLSFSSGRQYMVDSGAFANEGPSGSGGGVNRAALPSGLSALG